MVPSSVILRKRGILPTGPKTIGPIVPIISLAPYIDSNKSETQNEDAYMSLMKDIQKL